MATTDSERSHLLLRHDKAVFRLKRLPRILCIPYTGALVVLVWSLLLHSPGPHRIAAMITLGHDGYDIGTIIMCSLIISLLLYPVAGILAETRFTRFKFLIGGTIVSIIGIVLLIVAASLNIHYDGKGFQNHSSYSVTLVVGLIVFQFGLSMFEANVIQFGVDQLQFASNEELSKFVHWYFWTLSAIQYTLTCLIPAIPYSVSFVRNYYIKLFLPQTVFSLLCCLLSLLLVGIAYKRRYLLIEPISRSNPVTLIWRVMKYIRHHSQPVRRSAFTYGDPPPSRLDIAKERYGGPFTTEQVEDVKSFWRIGFLLSTSIGLSFTSEYDSFSLKMIDNLSDTASNSSSPLIPFYLAENIAHSYTLYYSVIIIGIPVYMCLIRPCVQPWLPSMLKRIGIGLTVICVTSMLYTANDWMAFYRIRNNIDGNCMMKNYDELETLRVQTFILQNEEKKELVFALLLLSHFCRGLGYTLIYLTSFEFILAQAPITMQGLLIGLWYAYQSLGIAITMFNVLPIKFLICHYWVYTVKTLLAFVSLFLYIIVARQFKYRQREEPSNINYRSVIEEYTQRQLDKEKTTLLQDEYIINDGNGQYKLIL